MTEPDNRDSDPFRYPPNQELEELVGDVRLPDLSPEAAARSRLLAHLRGFPLDEAVAMANHAIKEGFVTKESIEGALGRRAIAERELREGRDRAGITSSL